MFLIFLAFHGIHLERACAVKLESSEAEHENPSKQLQQEWNIIEMRTSNVPAPT